METRRHTREVGYESFRNVDRAPFRRDILETVKEFPIATVSHPAILHRLIDGDCPNAVRFREVLQEIRFREARLEDAGHRWRRLPRLRVGGNLTDGGDEIDRCGPLDRAARCWHS